MLDYSKHIETSRAMFPEKASQHDEMPMSESPTEDSSKKVGKVADSSTVTDDTHCEDDYIPDGIYISEARKQELRRETEIYLKELIEEFGEPTPEELARAEAWWRPIIQHLRKNTNKNTDE